MFITDLTKDERNFLAHINTATRKAQKLSAEMFSMMVEHFLEFGPCELEESAAEALARFALYLKDIQHDVEQTDESYIYGRYGLVEILKDQGAAILWKRQDEPMNFCDYVWRQV